MQRDLFKRNYGLTRDVGFSNREPIARSQDPDTSSQAAREYTESGLRDTHKGEILNLVERNPGKTAREIAKLMPEGYDNETAHKRLPDLERDGLVRKGEPRSCTVTGRKAVVWYRR